ncbi:hypothetical protein ONS95_012103 [Cadophora gregata]|uniref:uncharacterized protein n=1 Tax=Cadophora gregata TaxID=51156 RepID=UPI0026DC9EDD|nr:uncharacterized protein ONS95_012103 [Cadophora gregata]KAK0117778.1 hypothetical protein ONS95_012103 [Cadophora gregata]KAK0122828.1 hypothetical protein ONS96_009860 [Cadophora gregata f. sp. sojae]
MTWASIVAAPPPPSPTKKSKFGVKTNPAIPPPLIPEIADSLLEVQDLSLDGPIEPEGFVDSHVSTHAENSNPTESREKTKPADVEIAIETGESCDENGTVEKTEEETLNEYLNPRGDKTIQWCIDHKDEILDLHSSVAWTKVFQKECDGCGRFFKHCMFSNSERRARLGYSNCRWCNIDKEVCNEAESFTIHHHLHCNRGGKKECGTHWGLNIVRPKKKVESIMQGNGLRDVESPNVVMRVDRGVSQKEKKRREKRAREMSGL